MIGGPTRRARHLHFAPKRKRRRGLRMAAVLLVLLVLAGGAVVIKALAATTPPLAIHRTLPARVILPGKPPAPAWPSEGEAAAEVQGLLPLGSSGRSTPLPIASLAKIMTAYVVLHDHPLAAGQAGFTVSVTAADVADYHQRLAQAESVVPVALGEDLSEYQLLQGLLVASGNNFASILADHDAGSTTAFVTRMQAMAATLGMHATTYTDPSGLAPATVSTASDQLALAARAMAEPVFAQIVAMTSATLPVAGRIANFNTAVGSSGYVGVKTGSDATAGGCLVFANRQKVGGHTVTILGVVLGQSPGLHSTPTLIAAAVHAADRLVQSITTALSVQTVVAAGTTVATVSGRDGKETPVVAGRDLTVMGYGGMSVPVSVALDRLGSSVPAGAPVATISVAGAGTTEGTTRASVPAVSLGWKLRHDF